MGMSIYRSYLKKNNTILKNSHVNMAKGRTTELRYGSTFSKYLLQIDLDALKAKVAAGDLILNSGVTHTLHLTNCITADPQAVGELNGTQRTSSFDLVVFKISQPWDEGVGYEMDNQFFTDSSQQKLYSENPSNWYNATTLSAWTEPGIYTTNLTGGTTAQVIATQHFDNGNEDLDVDITSYINSVLTGGTTDYGLGVAFSAPYENVPADIDQTVSFFTKYTQTFFEPYLQTQYNDLITDDRNTFTLEKDQNLCLYVTSGGRFVDLDQNPTVTLLDEFKNLLDGYESLPTTKIAKGVYAVKVNLVGTTPCENKLYFYDTWNNLSLNGRPMQMVTQKFVPRSFDSQVNFVLPLNAPKYVPFAYGIKSGEKIIRGDVRKILVEAKELINGTKVILDQIYYRIYVKEGKTQVDVQDWTPVNKTLNENNFFLDTSFLIPKEYFMDVKVVNNLEIATLREAISFQIVSER
jgi:hypothetical protein